MILLNEDDVGKRIDKVVLRHLGLDSRSMFKKRVKRLLVGAKEVKPSYICKKGDEIAFELFEEDENKKSYEGFAEIIYEDEHLLIVNKKEGQLVYPYRRDEPTYVEYIKNFIKEPVENFLDPSRAGIVHRLDRETSGILILAKTSKALKKLSKQFKNRSIYKEYVVLVLGNIFQHHDCIDLPISREKKYNRRKIDVYNEDAQKALSEYEVIERKNGKTLLKVILHTGRTHQIRLHFSYIGYPVVGDRLYGKDKFREERLYLFARQVVFTHPIDGREMNVGLEVPDFFQKRLNVEKN